VLSELGARAEFRLRISGPLGRVTGTFTAMSVEQALRRLVEDHELMLIYSASPGEDARPKLIQADVFASTTDRHYRLLVLSLLLFSYQPFGLG
jgi:hypothetical protein